jgi:hypothetical protein
VKENAILRPVVAVNHQLKSGPEERMKRVCDLENSIFIVTMGCCCALTPMGFQSAGLEAAAESFSIM